MAGMDDLDRLRELEPHIEDKAFPQRFRMRPSGRTRWHLAKLDQGAEPGSTVNPDALFDVQIKRIHEYKRQLLNILQTIAHWHADQREPDGELGAAGEDLRRQIRAGLWGGQGNHPSYQ